MGSDTPTVGLAVALELAGLAAPAVRRSQLSDLTRRKEELQTELAKVEKDIEVVGQATLLEPTESRFEFLAKLSQVGFLLLNPCGKILKRNRNGRHRKVLSRARGKEIEKSILLHLGIREEKASGCMAMSERKAFADVSVIEGPTNTVVCDELLFITGSLKLCLPMADKASRRARESGLGFNYFRRHYDEK